MITFACNNENILNYIQPSPDHCDTWKVSVGVFIAGESWLHLCFSCYYPKDYLSMWLPQYLIRDGRENMLWLKAVVWDDMLMQN